MSYPKAFLGLALVMTGCAGLLGANDLSFEEEGAAGAGGNDSGSGCTSHRECTPSNWSEPSVCLEGACVPLTNDGSNCTAVMGEENLQQDVPPFVFGVLTGLPLDRWPAAQAQALAVSEFSTKGLRVGGKSALPVGVACDVVGVTSEALDASIDHLVDTLRVPLLVSSIEGPLLKRSFERVHQNKDKDVFFLSTYESDPLLTTIDDDGLLWHMLSSAQDLGPTFIPLIDRAEQYVRASLDGESDRPIRVALIGSDLAADKDIATYIDRNLVFNGLPASENGEHYLRLEVASDLLESLEVSTEAFVALRDFEPDIVVGIGRDEIVTALMGPLEDSRSEGVREPFYVLSYNTLSASALPFLLESYPSLLQRLAGVNFAAADDPTLYEEYLRSFSARFPNADGQGQENFYDAIYFGLYAAAGAGRVSELTGRDILRGMKRLINEDGRRYDVGTTDIPEVLSYLDASGSSTLALYGTMGAPTFDAGSGARFGKGSVWCISSDPENGLRLELDVLRYDPASKTLSGEFPCAPGF